MSTGAERSLLFKGTVLMGSIAVLVSALSIPSASAYVRPGRLELVSVSYRGGYANDEFGAHTFPVVSGNGRYVAFASKATDLVPNDRNDSLDIFRRDLKTGKTELVTVSQQGTQSAGGCVNTAAGDPLQVRDTQSRHPSISTNGRYITFQSCAANLVTGDTNILGADVFVRDMKKGTNEMVSVDLDSAASSSSKSGPQAISDNGRFVTFIGSNLDAGAAPWHVYLRDVKKNKTRMIDVTGTGRRSNGSSFVSDNFIESDVPSISGNGRYVAFTSDASNLGGEDEGEPLPVVGSSGRVRESHVFVQDMKTGKFEMVDVANDGSMATGANTNAFPGLIADVISYGPRVSRDGRYVTFASFADNLVPNDSVSTTQASPNSRNIFLRDRKTNRTTRIDVTSAGADHTSGAGSSVPGLETTARLGSMSADGRHIAFMTNSALEDDALTQHMYVHDVAMGSTQTIRTSKGKPVPQASGTVASSGRYVAFAGSGEVLPNDKNTHWDVFLLDRGTPLAVGGMVDDPSDFINRRSAAFVRTDDRVGDSLVGGKLGADLVGATIAHRPPLEDLYVRIDLEGMPAARGTGVVGDPTLVYSLRFTQAGDRYEVRVVLEGLKPVFGLFDCSGLGVCIKVADLKGGYGTTGESVVLSLPLAQIGDGAIRDADVVSGAGTFLTGAHQTLDTLTFSH